jgi:medium-chain acyl-[acyl-carrier-protein] hydrolase
MKFEHGPIRSASLAPGDIAGSSERAAAPAGISRDPRRWVPADRLAREIEPALRLFCFPYAGGGASIYRGWARLLPPHIEVRPIQMPGRENRIDEPALRRFDEACPLLADMLDGMLDRPFALFGHSMGALLAYGLTLELAARGRALPKLLVVSARRAPHMPSGRPAIHERPEPEFLQHLRELGGTPPEVLEHRELVELLTPVLRADFALNASLKPTEAPAQVPVPVAAFGAIDDKEVPRPALEAWRATTQQPFVMKLFTGGHFYIGSDRNAVVTAIADLLAPIAAKQAVNS